VPSGRSSPARPEASPKAAALPTALPAVLFSVLALLLGACAGDAEAGGEDRTGAAVAEGAGLLKVDVPLRALAWNPAQEVVYGLERDGERLLEVDPEELTGIDFAGPRPDAVEDSRKLPGAGENLAVDARQPGEIYVPQPNLDQVHVLGTEDLLDVREFDAGVPPARVTLDRYSDLLFALSQDGRTVTRVDLAGNEVVAVTTFDRGRATLAQANGAGSLWTAGPEGVALYGGPDLDLRGRVSLDAGGLAADPDDPERAYASDPEGGRVVAVEAEGTRDRLRVVAAADVGARYLAVERDRVYALGEDALTVLDSEDLEVLKTVDLDPVLTGAPYPDGKPSALTVGEENLYVALADAPYVLSLEKP
jgi:hypothetical protein